MKKKITFVYALIFLISLTFCFSGCQTSKKEIYLFSKGDFNYSEKITFKMGSCTQEKNWELYLRDEARRVKVDEEKLLKAEYIYRVQINLDADILNKTFSDEKMQSFVEETKTLVDAAPQEEKKDVFNRAAIRFLGLTGVVLSDEENCALYKNYLWHFLNNSPVFSEWNMFVEVSESPLVKSVVFDWFDVQNETPKNAEKPYLKEGVEKTYNETLRRTETRTRRMNPFCGNTKRAQPRSGFCWGKIRTECPPKNICKTPKVMPSFRFVGFGSFIRRLSIRTRRS